jgi:WhiB family redox-sensing transcriptional regulator
MLSLVTALHNDLRGQYWRLEAACRDAEDPDVFHSSNAMESRNIRKVCATCPVRQECLDYALRTEQRFGTYGGTTGTERSRMLGKRVHRPIQEDRLVASDLLMKQGYSLADIAARMGISKETLERSRQRARAAERKAS